MIISMTPLRISFFGGGTDIKKFYSKSYGAVLSTAIAKHIFVMVNKRFDKSIRVSYSETEIVDSPAQLRHQLIKQAMLNTGVTEQIEIVTIADIPGHGTGLGSSSTLAVGALNALYAYKDVDKTAEELAEEASNMEINQLGKPIGKQDQYAAAYGGLNYIKFGTDGRVLVSEVKATRSTLEELQGSLISFYVENKERDGDGLLRHQNSTAKVELNMEALKQMRDQAQEGKDYLEHGDLESFGMLLDKSWKLKKSLSKMVSTRIIDEYYEKGIKAGALGGKLSGAGGGGFLTFFCEPRYRDRIRKEFKGLRELDIEIEPRGSEILHLQKWWINERKVHK